jgi:hypothetical protein
MKMFGFVRGHGWQNEREGWDRRLAFWKETGTLQWNSPLPESKQSVDKWRAWLPKDAP